MFAKKYFFLVCLLLLIPVCRSFAQADATVTTEQTDKTQVNNPLDNIQDKIKNEAPQKINDFWKTTGLPFCKNIYGNADSWLAKNMPAARDEFVKESQSMPKELWESVKELWSWLVGPKK
jgi:hypothetical protein